MAWAPASVGRVEDGLFTVCSDCQAYRLWVYSHLEAYGQRKPFVEIPIT